MNALRRYLDEHDIPVREFALRVGCSQARIYHLMDGRKPSLDLAVKIERETNGRVTASDFVEARDAS